MEGRGLIIGIEYDKSVTQACVYDMKVNAPVACDGVKGTDICGAVTRIRHEYGIDNIDSLCITVKEKSMSELDMISQQIRSLLIDKDKYMIIGHIESFAYYAYSQRKELYKSGVVLMDYEEDTVNIHRLSYATVSNVQYIAQQSKQYSFENGSSDRGHSLACFVTEYFSKNQASSVYLTGKGFDVDRLPCELAKALIHGRKAYIGQNLYVRGACFAAYEQLCKDIFDNVILLVDGCIRVNIEVDIKEHEKPMRFRMIKQGTYWYMARRSADFIIEDMTMLPLKLVNAGGKCIEKIIDISSIPYREGKTTRIRLDIKAVSPDKCIITVKDLGFGELFRSSDKIITEEIDLREAYV